MSDASIKRLAQRQFGANAAEYGRSPVHAQGASLGRLVALTHPAADWRVLDVATAAGHTAFAFAPRVALVVATDITAEMIALAGDMAAGKGLRNVSRCFADAEALPFDDGAFDLVTCRIAPHHFGRVDLFLSEAFRVVRPGGLTAVADNIAPDDPAAARELDDLERMRDPSHARCLSAPEWRDAFTAAGYVVEHEEVDVKPMAFGEWMRRAGASADVQQELRRRFLRTSGALRAFLEPEPDGDDLRLQLHELLIVARRPEGRP